MSDLEFQKTGDPDVDAVFSSLKVQMRTWTPRTVGGLVIEDLASIVATQFYQTFEDPITPGWTYLHTGTPTFTYPSNGSAGGKALRVESDTAILELPYSLPINPDLLYRMRVRARVVTAPTATSYAHFGVQMLDSGGSYLDRVGGSSPLAFHRYVADSWDLSLATPGQWVTWEGYVKGLGATALGPSTVPSSPRLWDTNTVHYRPVIEVMDGATDGVVEIDYIAVQVITETPEIDDLLQTVDGLDKTVVSGTINADGTISTDNVPTDAIQDGAITGIKVGNRVIDTTHIALGGVTTDELANLAATKAKIGALAIDVTKIEDDAISTPKLQALAVTTAKLEAGAVTADKITVSQLSAIAANMGVLTAGKIEVGSMSLDAATERLLFGAATAPLVGTGIFLGKDGVDYEFRVGNPAGDMIHWDGSSLNIVGDGTNLINIDGGNITAGTVDTLQLAALAVTAGKIEALAIDTGHLAAGAVTTAKVDALAITSGLIAAGAVIAGKIAADAVTATEIDVGTLSAISADMGTLTAGTIQLGAATGPTTGTGIWMGLDVADWEFRVGNPAGSYLHWDGSTLNLVADGSNLSNLDGSQLANGSVDTLQIANSAITAALIDALAVDTQHLAALAVTGAKIEAGTIETGNIAALAITSGLLAAEAVIAGKIAADAVTANEINVGTLSAISADMGTLTAGTIQLGSATGPLTGVGIWMGLDTADWEFRAGNPAGNYIHWNGTTLNIVADGGNITGLDGANIDAGTVDTTQISDDAITNLKIAPLAVDTTEIAANAITTPKIAANAVTANEIEAGTITATEITGTTLSAIYADMGTITAGKIDVGSIEINADTERILFGSATAPLTGNGIFMGKDGTAYEFRVGDPSGEFMHFDGTYFNLEVGRLKLESELWLTDNATYPGSGTPKRIIWDGGAANTYFEAKGGAGGNDLTLTGSYLGTATQILYLNSDNVEIKRALKHTGSTAGFFSTTPISQPSAITRPGDSTNGTVGSALYEQYGLSQAADAATANDNFATLRDWISDIQLVLENLGLMA